MHSYILENYFSLYQKDCIEGMKQYPDNYFNIAIVDPPYFKGVATKGFYGGAKWKQGTSKDKSYKTICQWDDNIPGQQYFNELNRVSKHRIIWGVNYYSRYIKEVGRIIWDKKNDASSFSKAEIASSSFFNSVQIFRYLWMGMLQENMANKEVRIHPTQKPVRLYEWLLKNYAKEGDKILDTHIGSGSSVIACFNLGYYITGFEIDEYYFKTMRQRIEEHMKQQRLFG